MYLHGYAADDKTTSGLIVVKNNNQILIQEDHRGIGFTIGKNNLFASSVQLQLAYFAASKAYPLAERTVRSTENSALLQMAVRGATVVSSQAKPTVNETAVQSPWCCAMN